MSVEATGWAYRQQLPPKAKIVLVMLADQTDERTGQVCYGKTDMKHLAKKSCIPERSLYRYLAALIRNGYVIRQSGKREGKVNELWLCLDRPLSRIEDWVWNAPTDAVEAEADDETSEGGSAMVAEGDDAIAVDIPPDVEKDSCINSLEGLPSNGGGGMPLVAEQESTEDHSNQKGATKEAKPSEPPSSFSRQSQDGQLEASAIKRAAATNGAPQFVIQNSSAWKAWLDYRRKVLKLARWELPTTMGQGKFIGKVGWYLPELFPPRDPDKPPDRSMMNSQDVRDFQ